MPNPLKLLLTSRSQRAAHTPTSPTSTQQILPRQTPSAPANPPVVFCDFIGFASSDRPKLMHFRGVFNLTWQQTNKQGTVKTASCQFEVEDLRLCASDAANFIFLEGDQNLFNAQAVDAYYNLRRPSKDPIL